MDEGKLDESIKLLEESQKLDPENYMYPYEIAYAYVQKKKYEKAIKILNNVKKEFAEYKSTANITGKIINTIVISLIKNLY